MISNALSNKEIAKILKWYADYIALDSNDIYIQYRRKSYEEAAKIVELMPEPLDLKVLLETKGIGPKIFSRVKEIIETNKLRELNRLIDKFGDFRDMTTVAGVGIKTARKLYEDYGITTAAEIVQFVKEGKITNKTIISGLANKDRRLQRVYVEPIAKKLTDFFHTELPECNFELCGSWRRMKQNIKDLDALTDAPLDRSRDVMLKLGTLIEDGKSKISTLVDDIKFELRVASPESYGSFLLHLTGPWPYNQHLRKIAKDKGFTLNEYGLHLKGENLTAFKSEREIVEFLGETFLSPEERGKHYEHD